MIELKDKADCSGCAACESVCTHGCIKMKADAEGFPYPVIDATKCVQCGLCEKGCPIINIPTQNNIKEVIAAKNMDEDARFSSSSGGVFRLLAEHVLNQNGLVVGCRFNNDMAAGHVIVNNIADLKPLLSSKYVQSDTRGIYTEVRKYLLEGKQVLFSGVPCQVAALKNYLMRPYSNLITIDILCHGVPSPRFFKEYLNNLENRYGGKAASVSFRYKEKSWKRLYINALFYNGKRHFLYAGYDSYMQLFLSDKLQRQSCFQCPYNSLHRPGDITLGDFWGIGKSHYDFDDNKGVSMVLINNEVGKSIWDKISKHTTHFASDLETAIAGNKVLVQHLPSRQGRDEFYADYVAEGFKKAVAKHAPEASFLNRKYHDFMRFGLDILRKIKREGY